MDENGDENETEIEEKHEERGRSRKIEGEGTRVKNDQQ